jgi:hypothetical protein
MTTLKHKNSNRDNQKNKSNNKSNNKSDNKSSYDSYLGDTLLTTNTIVQILGLQLYKYFSNKEITGIDFVSDSIILTLSNLTLNKISQVDTYLATTIKDIYYPVTSALFFTAYNNMMYDASYIKSLSLIAPLTIGEYYFLKLTNY